MKIIEEYLSSLNEIDFKSLKDAYIKKRDLGGGVKMSGKQIGSHMATTAAFAVGIPAAQKAFSLATSGGERQCWKFTGPGRERCVQEANIRQGREKQKKLMAMMPACQNTPDPEACQKELRIKHRMVEFDIREAQQKLLAYKQSLQAEGKNLNEIDFGKMAAGATKNMSTGAKWALGTAAASIIGTVVSKALFVGWRTALAMFDDAARKCGTFGEGPARNMCMSKIKLQSLTKQQQILRQVLVEANKTQDQNKISKVQAKLNELNQKMQIEKDNINLYQKAAVRAASVNLMQR